MSLYGKIVSSIDSDSDGCCCKCSILTKEFISSLFHCTEHSPALQRAAHGASMWGSNWHISNVLTNRESASEGKVVTNMEIDNVISLIVTAVASDNAAGAS